MSELRQDLITGKWVVIAKKRKKRPHNFCIQNTSKTCKCPFCNPKKSGQNPDTYIIKDKKGEWIARSFQNLFPAFEQQGNLDPKMDGPYKFENAIGFHEVIVTRDHKKSLGLMEVKKVAKVINLYQKRYLDLMNKRFVRYISIFHNHGQSAGASIEHPHSQLIAVPEVPSDIYDELKGSQDYFQSNQRCAYCTMIAFEKEDEERIVFENESIIAFCPFASRAGYEIWIIPKKHEPYFERAKKTSKIKIASALKICLQKIHKLLNNIDYNFYLHTAPCDGRLYDHYHWHIEILPKSSIWAGFELGTGVEINPFAPEETAKEIRETKIEKANNLFNQFKKILGK